MPFSLFNNDHKKKNHSSSSAYPGAASASAYPGAASASAYPGAASASPYPAAQQPYQNQQPPPLPGRMDMPGTTGTPPYPYQPSQPYYPAPYAGQNPPNVPGPPMPGYPIAGNPTYPQPPGSLHNPYGAPYNPNQPVAPPAPFQLHQSGNNQPPPPQNYSLSNCTGRKRALLIGINYTGTTSALRGCINDVQNLKNFIIQYHNFRECDMVILTDDQRDPSRIPTRANMIAAMKWLVHDARPNDSFFLHFSGHGTSVSDKDGDEADGNDEAICPLDYKTAGLIVDDEIHALCVAPLPSGVRLTAIFDSCHSGTAMDLPYVYSTTGELKTNTGLKSAGKNLASAVPAYLKGNKMGALMSIGNSLMGAVKGQGAEEHARATRTSPADVIMFSGCKDSQTSADAQIAGNSTGAMSYAFRTALERNRQQSYQQLLISIRDILKQKYDQLPQLSSSHPMDMRLLFIM